MTPPKILCISLGSIGKRHVRNARTLLPKAQIAVWRQHTRDDSVPEGANLMLPSLHDALAFAPDAVIVSSPASEHVANALPFVQRHIPLFIEKPLASRGDMLGAFVQACQASRGFIMVGYVLRFLPALHKIRQWINDGALGDVYTARIEVGQYLPDWRPDADYRTGVSAQAKLGGGALLELSHEIDYATWLFGWPQSLLCSRAHISPLQIDVEDSAHIIMEYENKRIALQLDFLQRSAHMAVQVVGSKGTLAADLIKETITIDGTPVPCEQLPNGNDIYLRQFDCFFSKALPGYTPAYAAAADWATIEHAAAVVQLVDLAKKASDTGMRQSFAEPRRTAGVEAA